MRRSEGRSGGGLFNEKGELIGVCYAADYEGNEGLYAALDSIHDEVVRLNLFPSKDESEWGPTEGTPRIANDDKLVRQDPVVRGQDNPSPSHASAQPRTDHARGRGDHGRPVWLAEQKTGRTQPGRAGGMGRNHQTRFAIRSDHYRAPEGTGRRERGDHAQRRLA